MPGNELPKSKKTYLEWTYNSKNPLRRFSHRSRYAYSMKILDLHKGDRLLDFGCGDGLFLNKLIASKPGLNLHLLGFEPYMESITNNSQSIVKDWGEVENHVAVSGKFQWITSFEVFEHFNPQRQKDALDRMYNVLDKDGKLAISVPIEVGLPAIVKTTIRRINHPHNKKFYNIKNAIKSLLGRPLPEFRQGDNYLSHVGFYFKDLEDVLSEKWQLESKFYSPLKMFNASFNSQVFYVYKKK